MTARPALIDWSDDDLALADEEARRRLCQEKLIHFIYQTTPYFIGDYYHYAVCEYLEALEAGEIRRLLISLPPRGTKTTIVSKRFTAWAAGRKPNRKFMIGCHSADMAKSIGREVRNLIRTSEYQAVFPGLKVAADTSAADDWNFYRRADDDPEDAFIERGEFFSMGVNTGIAGKGYNIGILDDPLSEQHKDSKLIKDKLWDWYPGGFYTRRQPEENAIVVMATRWANDDLTGHLLERAKDGGEQWETLFVPAYLDQDARRKIVYICQNIGLPQAADDLEVGGSFSPRRFPREFIEDAERTLPRRDFQALYMQQPTDDEGNILKRSYWRLWAKRVADEASPSGFVDNPLPLCSEIIQCWDTAFEEGEENDYSARTTWGLFTWDGGGLHPPKQHVILLDAWRGRVEFPDLCDEVFNAYRNKKLRPDRILIEKRASGHSLLQEMKRQGLPVFPWLPPGARGSKGKVPRAHLAAGIMQQGAVWYAEAARQAEEVIDECASFRGTGGQSHDDWTDTVTMALSYLRQAYWLELDHDQRARNYYPDDYDNPQRRPRRLYGNAGSVLHHQGSA